MHEFASIGRFPGTLRDRHMKLNKSLGVPLSAAVAVVLALTGCAGPAAPATGPGTGIPVPNIATSATSTVAEDSVSLVVVGDSIPDTINQDCLGCVGFVDLFADHLAEATGKPVSATNLSSHDNVTLAALSDQLANDATVEDALGSADVLLVSVGFNNGPPWPADRPCGGQEFSTIEGQIAQLAAYTPECIQDTIDSYRPEYEAIFSRINDLTAGRDPLKMVLTIYNNWIGFPGLDESTSQQLNTVLDVTVSIFDQWNAMLCGSAEAAGFACVDSYHGLNGPNGDQAAGEFLARDYTHLSEAGNDLIADLLAEIDTQTLSG